jgi:phosphoglycolate phosphatase
VGDTPIDMDTARAAGMYAVGVTWGFRSPEQLRAHGARALASTAEELLEALLRAPPPATPP